MAEDLVDQLEPIRISAAAMLLELAGPTVESWIKHGLLIPAQSPSAGTRLDPHRVHEVRHLVLALRKQGAKSGTLLEQVWYQLQDQSLLDRSDLQEGIAAWRSGDIIDA